MELSKKLQEAIRRAVTDDKTAEELISMLEDMQARIEALEAELDGE